MRTRDWEGRNDLSLHGRRAPAPRIQLPPRSDFEFFHAGHGFFDVFAGIEGADAEVAFAAGAEAAAGRADDVGFAEQLVEEVPTADLPRRFQPYIRRVDPAKHLQAKPPQLFADDL